MKLKLKRRTRTPYSEEIEIYDLDTLDEEEALVQIGKLDVHYVDDQIVGTLLMSQEFTKGYSQLHGGGSIGQSVVDQLITEVLSEISEPIGVSATYAIEVYYPAFARQGFFTNYADEGDQLGGALETDEYEDEYAEDEYAEEEEQNTPHPPIPPPPGAPPEPSTLFPPKEDDDFTRRLRER
jgi:hypothetical protein